MDIDSETRPAPTASAHADDDGPEADDLTRTVEDAKRGDQGAWRELYRRYNALVLATAQRFRIPHAAIEDVSQSVWSLLFTHLDRIHEPRALPGWIVTTTRNEVYRMLRADARCEPFDPTSDRRLEVVDDVEPGANIYRAELRRELDSLLAELSTGHRQLMHLLMADPQPSYAEISRRLRIPLGSIGPTRSRCLARMRANSRGHEGMLAWAA